jgi:Kef-type K+ transport system membrane component KefB
MENLVVELSIIIFIAVGLAAVMRFLKQPLLIGYILTGIVVSVFHVVTATETLSFLGQIGIAFLLFMVGLNINPKVIKEVGKVSVLTGIGQVLITASIGYFLLQGLGYSLIESLYIAVAVTFSSTIIIMKLLADKGDLDKLYGRISVGFLIVQDIIVIFVLMLISSSAQSNLTALLAFNTIAKGIGFLLLLYIIGAYILPRIMKYIAESQEFLLLFSISWCLLLAAFFWYLNFSFEIGALLAGISLSLSPYRYEISAKMRPLRDFFLVVFFIILGSQLQFSAVSWFAVLVLVLFIIIGNPLILIAIMGWLRYTRKTSFFVGLTVAQVSEFSFIMIALGVSVGHIHKSILSYVTIVGLITIALSVYMIMYAEQLYRFCAPVLGIFERKGKKIDSRQEKTKEYDILLFGYNKMGYDLLASFKKLRKKFLIIDYDPEIVMQLTKKGYDCKYGDASDAEFMDELTIAKTKMIVSMIPDVNVNSMIVNKAKEKNKQAILIVLSHRVEDAMHLYQAGATYVVMPHMLGGHHTSELIKQNGLSMKKFLLYKTQHLKNLKERKKQHNILHKAKKLVRKHILNNSSP